MAAAMPVRAVPWALAGSRLFAKGSSRKWALILPFCIAEKMPGRSARYCTPTLPKRMFRGRMLPQSRRICCGRRQLSRLAVRRTDMLSKIFSAAVLAGFIAVTTAPIVAYADDASAPKTKAECKKTKDMKWDSKSKTCVKK
jgi:hypothetical protein